MTFDRAQSRELAVGGPGEDEEILNESDARLQELEAFIANCRDRDPRSMRRTLIFALKCLVDNCDDEAAAQIAQEMRDKLIAYYNGHLGIDCARGFNPKGFAESFSTTGETFNVSFSEFEERLRVFELLEPHVTECIIRRPNGRDRGRDECPWSLGHIQLLAKSSLLQHVTRLELLAGSAWASEVFKPETVEALDHGLSHVRHVTLGRYRGPSEPLGVPIHFGQGFFQAFADSSLWQKLDSLAIASPSQNVRVDDATFSPLARHIHAYNINSLALRAAHFRCVPTSDRSGLSIGSFTGQIFGPGSQFHPRVLDFQLSSFDEMSWRFIVQSPGLSRVEYLDLSHTNISVEWLGMLVNSSAEDTLKRVTVSARMVESPASDRMARAILGDRLNVINA